MEFTSNIQIRRFIPSDQGSVVSNFMNGFSLYYKDKTLMKPLEVLYLDTILGPGGDMSNIYEYFKIGESEADSDRNFWVAEKDREVVGGVGVIPSPEYADGAELIRMSVKASCRGHGVAGKLMDVLISWAIGKGYNRVVLSTGGQWEEAKRFYTKHGFHLYKEKCINTSPELNGLPEGVFPVSYYMKLLTQVSTPGTLHIRRFIPSDQEAISAIFKAGFSLYFEKGEYIERVQTWFLQMKLEPGGDMHDIYEYFKIGESEADSDRNFWVAEKDGEVVGGVGVIPSPEYVDGAELIRMSVKASCRGHGIAGKLMDVLISWAIGKGYKRVVLSTGTIMEQAKRTYLKYGFHLVEEKMIKTTKEIGNLPDGEFGVSYYMKEL